jgi:hypothetical protein
MNTENFKTSKFEAFRGHVIKNPFQIYGGQSVGTTYNEYDAQSGALVNKGADTWNWGPGETNNTRAFGQFGDMKFCSPIDLDDQFDCSLYN